MPGSAAIGAAPNNAQNFTLKSPLSFNRCSRQRWQWTSPGRPGGGAANGICHIAGIRLPVVQPAVLAVDDLRYGLATTLPSASAAALCDEAQSSEQQLVCFFSRRCWRWTIRATAWPRRCHLQLSRHSMRPRQPRSGPSGCAARPPSSSGARRWLTQLWASPRPSWYVRRPFVPPDN